MFCKPFNDSYWKAKKGWLLLLIVLLLLAYQVDNVPRTDDEYLGEQVFWLLKTGKVKSELGYEALNYNIYQSIYHKLFVYAGYISCRLNGWSLLSLHLVAYICFLCFLCFFYYYIRKQYGPQYKAYLFGLMALLLTNQDLLYAIGNFRPEIMLMGIGFASYVLLLRYLEGGRYYHLVLSAICSGAGMLTHLNGAIFIFAGCLLLCRSKQFKNALVYAGIATSAFSFYFADILYNADLEYFWVQFTHDPVLQRQTGPWYTLLFRLLQEQSRFFFTGKQIIFTISLLSVLLLSYKKLRQTHARLLLYTAALVIGLACICPSKSTKYMVLYLPFLYILLVEGWYYIEAQKKEKAVALIRSMLGISIAISMAYSIRHICQNIDNLSTGGPVEEYKAIVGKISDTSSCINLLAPRAMVFNELGKFKSLRDIELIAAEHFRAYLINSDIDYVVFSEKELQYFDMTHHLVTEKHSLLLSIARTRHYWLTKVRR